MTTSIDKIREQVRGVREEHKRAGSPGDGVRPYCQNPRCPLVTDDFVSVWPCPTLRLAEDKLKLAEALEDIRQVAKENCYPEHRDGVLASDHELYCIHARQEIRAERILAECAEEKA